MKSRFTTGLCCAAVSSPLAECVRYLLHAPDVRLRYSHQTESLNVEFGIREALFEQLLLNTEDASCDALQSFMEALSGSFVVLLYIHLFSSE